MRGGIGRRAGGAILTRHEIEIAAARAKLQPFSETAACDACGFGAVATAFHPKHERRWDDLMERLLGVATSFVPFDLMQRRCTRCGKSWAELPLGDGREVTE